MTEEKRDKNTRVCAGCGKRVSPDELVRVVLDPTGDEATVVVDVSGSAFGHGAHVHPTRDCVTKACVICAKSPDDQAGFLRALRKRTAFYRKRNAERLEAVKAGTFPRIRDKSAPARDTA